MWSTSPLLQPCVQARRRPAQSLSLPLLLKRKPQESRRSSLVLLVCPKNNQMFNYLLGTNSLHRWLLMATAAVKTTPVSLLPRWTELLALYWVVPSHTLSKTTILFHLVVGSFTLHLGSIVMGFLLNTYPSSSNSQRTQNHSFSGKFPSD